MVMNDSAYYEEKLWCAYELKNRDGSYDEELRLLMRKESQKNKFICPDCGEHLILCAGPVMEPFFKHHENSNCIISHATGSKSDFTARRILYQLAKDSFPQAEFMVNPKLSVGVIPTILIILEDKKIALKYLSSEIKLDQWEAEHEYYLENEIIDLWFLNSKRYYEDRLTTFEYLISKTSMPLKLIDSANNQLILKEKCLAKSANREIIVCKSYALGNIRINQEGQLTSDFTQHKKAQVDAVNYQAEYYIRTYEEQIKVKQQEVQEKRQTLQEEYTLQNRKRKEEQQIQKERRESLKVIRSPLKEETDLSGKMKMLSLDEAWDVPRLAGKDMQIRIGNGNRYTYLKKLDQELKGIFDEGEKNRRVHKAVEYLERNTLAAQWKQ